MPMEGPGTGGGTTDLCNVSPFDQSGTIDNLIDRIEALETAVAILAGSDVSVEQLSDVSESLGWINDVTYLGTEGWTQTPSGTLIPPPGWSGLASIIDGESGLTDSIRRRAYCFVRRSAASASSEI